MCRWRDWNNHFCSYPQSERSKRARNGIRATPEHWWGCRNTFRPVITVPRERSIKRVEDPPRWHLESLHTAALINQTVSGLNMASLKTPQNVVNVWNNRGTLQREGYSQILSAKMWHCPPPCARSREIKGSVSVFLWMTCTDACVARWVYSCTCCPVVSPYVNKVKC